jgi:hypothetical protein
MEDQVLDVDFNLDDNKESVELIGVNKFIILYFLSLGLYGPWWMYKSWNFFKVKDGLDIIPAARAIFAIFFTFQLFERILNFAKSNGYTNSYSSGGLFLMFVVLNLLARLPDPFWVISLLAFVCLIQPLKALNYAILNSNNYRGIESDGFNSRQIVILIGGGLLWLLIIIGLLVNPEDL